MREYAKVSPKFWIDRMGKSIRKLGSDAQLIALYLTTNPNSTMIGIYYLPINLIVHETGLPFEKVSQLLNGLCEIGFCHYDFEMEYVWVIEMACGQIGGQLKTTDNRVKGINDDYQSLPELPFLSEFFERYTDLFHLTLRRGNTTDVSVETQKIQGLEVPCKLLASQEQEQEKETEQEQNQKQEQEQKQEQKQKQKINIVARTRRCDESSPEFSEIEFVFSHWKLLMQHPNAKLDDKRRKLIKNALKLGYTTEQICHAITGCSYTPHNIGNNDRGQRYDGLHIILRDADQIDRFISNFHHPPRPLNAADKLMQSNWMASQQWLAAKNQEKKPDETE